MGAVADPGAVHRTGGGRVFLARLGGLGFGPARRRMFLMNDHVDSARQPPAVQQFRQTVLIMGLDPFAHETGRDAGAHGAAVLPDEPHGLDPALIGGFADLGAQGFTNFQPGFLQVLAGLYVSALLFRHFATNIRSRPFRRCLFSLSGGTGGHAAKVPPPWVLGGDEARWGQPPAGAVAACLYSRPPPCREPECGSVTPPPL